VCIICMHYGTSLQYGFRRGDMGSPGGGLNEVPRVVYVFCS